MQAFFEQIMRVPATVFSSGVGLFTQTLKGVRGMTLPGGGQVARLVTPAVRSVRDVEVRGAPFSATTITKEDTKMKDGDSNGKNNVFSDSDRDRDRSRDLGGEDLKLVRYKVIFVKRDYEVAFPEREELVADNLNDTDFTAWKIAEFIQHLDEEPVPRSWRDKNYPRSYDGETDPRVRYIDEGDKKYLRVYFEVMTRYEREEFHHDEREVGVLEEIRDAIKNRP